MVVGYAWFTEEKKDEVDGILVFFAVVFLALSVIGPWVAGVLGRIVSASATPPAPLLAGRRMLDDPTSAWRTVSGLAFAGFVALFGVAGGSPWVARACSPWPCPRAPGPRSSTRRGSP
ncbi:hypothetical protein PV682_37960 [Streptomyces niveiscabiei]|uniref:hypothetical protein n=1 Tax=Streptomyces niveiscabiei TaxID=164115 RepID=UPI0029A2F88D|nr:hypothetical protein [Streptomyces niveiscabiei]MDX3387187.1 hypothetical protein [Streptomyces niveiscabiei]